MIRVRKISKGLWGITSSWSPTVRDVCRSIPGMRWDAPTRAWVGYVDAISSAASKIKEKGLFIEDPPEPDQSWDPGVPVADADMRDYQKLSIRFLVATASVGALLTLEMGLGKSACAARAARALRQKTLVVCPNFVKGVWEKELAKWWPAAVHVTLNGTKPNLEELTHCRVHRRSKSGKQAVTVEPAAIDVAIINYDVAHAWVSTLQEWGFRTVIFDEGHYLQSQKSRRSLACRALAEAAIYKIALTGTPLTNRPKDLFNLVDTISPGRFGNFFQYGLAFCDAHREEVTRDKVVWVFDGKSNPEELGRRLKFFMLRRTKEDVLLELPSKTRQVLEVDVPAKVRISPNASMLHSPKILRAALNAAADGKIPQVIELVRSHVDEGHSVIVACHRRAVAETISNAFADVGSGLIHGGFSLAQRQATIDRKPTVLAVTIESVGVGIDLTFANVMVVAELTWEPHELAQLEARTHRFGQKRNVLIQYVIAKGTTDELIADAVIQKLDTINRVIGKSADGLKEDLEGSNNPIDPLKALYDAFMASSPAEEERPVEKPKRKKKVA
jgi:SWI/SNF-related matrix-associated actin-dependent regulator 1 of chromatin subfamily A